MILPSKPSKRRALVIGNSFYKDLAILSHAVRDAEDISAKLSALKFQVTLSADLDYDKMIETQDEFLETITERDIILFFYSGYGIQWKNQNYLLPINDDEITSDYMLPYHTMHTEKFLQQIIDHEASTVIFLLDVSFSDDFTYTSRKSFFINNLYVPNGCIILCGNGSCNPPDDGSTTNRNGLFTQHVLNHLDKTNYSLDEILNLIHDEVVKDTDGLHDPVLINSLSSKVYLNTQARYAPLCPVQITPDSKWMQNGITVAGGHGHGIGNNQLFNPWSVYIDDDMSILIADQLNHRIIEWKTGSPNSGHVIAGGNGQGDGINQLSCPTDIFIDHRTDSLIICDRDNRRIVRWPRHNGRFGEVLISDIDCIALTIDNDGHIYVSDDKKHEVRRYESGATHGVRVAGGNGRGNRCDQLNEPRYIFVDQQGSLYVSDHGNHRVIMWPDGAECGHTVIGDQNNEKNSVNLYFPQGIVVDQKGSVYVAESGKHRIVRWSRGATEPQIIVGGQCKGTKPNELNWPFGLCFDRHQNLYVVDVYNHRVQKFHLDP